jgi:hypothetical protein
MVYNVGYLLGWALAPVADSWLWVVGSRRIRIAGRYTMKYWRISLVVFTGLTLLLSSAGDENIASTVEPKADSIAQAHEQPVAPEPKLESKNKMTAETFVDFTESHYPGTIEGVCLSYDKFGDDAWRSAFAKGYDERVKSYAQQLPTAEEFLDELLSRCSL